MWFVFVLQCTVFVHICVRWSHLNRMEIGKESIECVAKEKRERGREANCHVNVCEQSTMGIREDL